MRRYRMKDDRGETKPFVCQRCGADALVVISAAVSGSPGETVIVGCGHCGTGAWLQVEYSSHPDERPNVEIKTE